MIEHNRKTQTGLMAMVLICTSSPLLAAVNLGAVPFAPDNTAVRLEQVGTVSGGTQQMAYRGNKLYFANRSGVIEEFTKNLNGSLTNEPGVFLNVATERSGMFSNTTSLNGLRGIAFHPDYDQVGADGFGKFYTQHIEAPLSTPDHDLKPEWATTPTTGINKVIDSVLFEWNYSSAGVLQSSVQSSREVYRVRFPAGHHVGQQIAFDPTATPADADYGNLHLTYGESGGKNDAAGFINFSSDTIITTAPQDPTSILGKIVRINPLQNGPNAFSIPANTNPFPGNPNTLPEIYAAGFRNPQTLSFDTETGQLFVGDIGQRNIEEINLIEEGKNYGWSQREGSYRFATPFNANTLVEDDLATRQADGYTDPVAQFDHVDGGGTQAVVGGSVYHGTLAPRLAGKYLFSSLSVDRLYVVDTVDLVNDDAPASVLQLPLVDEFGNPTSLSTLVGSNRANVRFGQDDEGELYIISKANGGIYRFRSAPAGFDLGDLDFNGTIDELDWDLYRSGLDVDLSGLSNEAAYQMGDLDGDLDNDINDFAQFKSAYENANGIASLAMLSVPEPSSLSMFGFASCLVALTRGKPVRARILIERERSLASLYATEI